MQAVKGSFDWPRSSLSEQNGERGCLLVYLYDPAIFDLKLKEDFVCLSGKVKAGGTGDARIVLQIGDGVAQADTICNARETHLAEENVGRIEGLSFENRGFFTIGFNIDVDKFFDKGVWAVEKEAINKNGTFDVAASQAEKIWGVPAVDP